MLKETITQYFSVFLGVFFVVAGNGLLNMYFPIYAKASISASEIGLITTAYYMGFFLGCVKVLGLIRRVGFVRAFMFVSTLIGASGLLFTMSDSTWFWFPLRFVMGVGYAGLYVVIESWINALVGNESRGRVYGTYRLVELGSLAIGQNLIVLLEGKTGHYHFSMITLLTILSALPLGLTLLPQPSISSESISVNVKKLWKNSQYSTGMMFMVGMTNSVIWMLTPLMLLNIGIKEGSIPKVFFFFILGGIISQYPIGSLSDRLERRTINNILTLMAAILAYSFTLKQYFTFQFELLFFLLGVLVMPQYSLVMTHAMDKSNKENAGRISSQMLLLYSIGGVFGPVTCGLFIKYFTVDGQPLYLLTIFFMMFLFGLGQRVTRTPVEKKNKENFKIFPELSPIIFNKKRKLY